MKNGQCPKCGSSEVRQSPSVHHRMPLPLSSLNVFEKAKIICLVCTACGYLEEYVLDRDKLAQIAEKWPRVK